MAESAGRSAVSASGAAAAVSITLTAQTEGFSITGGAFDVTLDPLIRLWGFGPAGRRPGSRHPADRPITLTGQNFNI